MEKVWRIQILVLEFPNIKKTNCKIGGTLDIDGFH